MYQKKLFIAWGLHIVVSIFLVTCIETFSVVDPVYEKYIPSHLNYSSNKYIINYGESGYSVTPSYDDGFDSVYFNLSISTDPSHIYSQKPRPNLLNIDQNGIISWKNGLMAGKYHVSVSIRNNYGSTSYPFDLTVNAIPPKDLNYSVTTSTNPVSNYIFFTDPGQSLTPTINHGGEEIYYSLSPTIDGIQIDSNSGVISWNKSDSYLISTSNTNTTTKPTHISNTPYIPIGNHQIIISATNQVGKSQTLYFLTVAVGPPTNLVYTSQTWETVRWFSGQTSIPSVRERGDTAYFYLLSKNDTAVPSEISINLTNGVVSWSNTLSLGEHSFYVIASNKTGTTSTPLKIVIKIVSPSNLSYSQPLIYTDFGKSGNSVSPSIDSGGDIVYYSIDSVRLDEVEKTTIPDEIKIDSSTGIIYWSNKVRAHDYEFQIKATNSKGSTLTLFRLFVSPTTPNDLIYRPNHKIIHYLESGSATPFSVNDGGEALTYNLKNHPTEVTIESVSGKISWSDQLRAGKYVFLISGSNQAGMVTADYQLTVDPIAPSNLTYPNSTESVLGNSGQLAPHEVFDGGEDLFYFIESPVSNITINHSNGTIFWDDQLPQGSYEVTVFASNQVATTSNSVEIIIKIYPPSSFIYPINRTNIFYEETGHSILPIINDGGGIVYFSISNLVAGVEVNPSNGKIVWNRVDAIPTGIHQLNILATNQAGNTTATYTLEVNVVAPTNLSYSFITTNIKNQDGHSKAPKVTPNKTGEVYYQLTSVPVTDHININKTNGIISWKNVPLGKFLLTVTVTNQTGEKTRSLEFKNTLPPRNFIYFPHTTRITKGITGESIIPTIINDGETTYFTLSNSYPGISINSNNGVIYWNEQASIGTNFMTIQASNQNGITSTTYSLIVEQKDNFLQKLIQVFNFDGEENPIILKNIFDLIIIPSTHGHYLYTVSYDNNGANHAPREYGLSGFKIESDGTLKNVFNLSKINKIQHATSLSTITIDGTIFLLVAGDNDILFTFKIETNGTLTEVDQVTDTSEIHIRDVSYMDAIKINNQHYLYAGGLENGLSSFTINAQGKLNNIQNISDSSSLYLNNDPDSFDGINSITISNRSFLYVAGGRDGGISAFEIGADGILTSITNIADSATSFLSGIGSLKTVSFNEEQNYLFSGSFEETGISVFKIKKDGNLENIDNVKDNSSTFISSIHNMNVFKKDNQSYLSIGDNASHGISIFNIKKSGELVNILNTRDNNSTYLHRTYAHGVTTIKENTFLIVSSTREDGLTVFKLE